MCYYVCGFSWIAYTKEGVLFMAMVTIDSISKVAKATASTVFSTTISASKKVLEMASKVQSISKKTLVRTGVVTTALTLGGIAVKKLKDNETARKVAKTAWTGIQTAGRFVYAQGAKVATAAKQATVWVWNHLPSFKETNKKAN